MNTNKKIVNMGAVTKKLTLIKAIDDMKDLTPMELNEYVEETLLFRKYVPYVEKKLIASIIVTNSVVKGEFTSFIDMSDLDVNFYTVLLPLYTTIDTVKEKDANGNLKDKNDNKYADYDMMKRLVFNETSSLCDILEIAIPEKELSEFRKIVNNEVDNWNKGHSSIDAVISKNIKYLNDGFGVTSKGIVEAIKSFMENEEFKKLILDNK